jgi:pilus assembly protein CpaE
VALVDIPSDNPTPALHAIELLHQDLPQCAVFAIGSMTQPQVIVNAMRAGAREFIERPTTTTDLLEAFVRLSAAQRKVRRDEARGKVFTVVNAKGGSGATTIAVNLALALQSAHSNVGLVDIASLGHAALHLNLKPAFSVADAIRNLHRLDSSLLESFMTRHAGGLQVLAGANTPAALEPSTAEFARLFDMMVSHFRYVVVDASTRLDAATRLVCNLSETVLLVAHTDVASLWSAARVLQYVADTGSRERVRLVLNRFRKIPGFSEADAEGAAGASLLWKIPNQYFAVSAAIDRGIPLMQQNHTDIARSFTGLASALTQNDDDVKRSAWSLFKTV